MIVEGAVFLVTGAASGLGAATARMLSLEGARVLLADLDQTAGRTLAQALGDTAHFVRTDVADEDSMAAAVAAAAALGPLRGLINCAGIAAGERLLGRQGPHRLDSFMRVLQINLVGSFNAVRLVAEAISRHPPDASGERGVIVNTASIAAFDGQLGQAAYAASKGGIVAMTLPLARELAHHAIRVMAIAPGAMETPMVARMEEQAQLTLCASVPFPQRLGRPEEFAALVGHILANTYLNGEVIRLDGALRMAAR